MARVLRRASDAAMPRAGTGLGGGRRAAYWWSKDIEDKRRRTNATRRRLLRARKKLKGAADTVETCELKREYSAEKNALRGMIRTAKEEAWRELLQVIDGDPWGKPYRVVLGRLRAKAVPVTMTMGREELIKMMREMFPEAAEADVEREERRLLATTRDDWREELEVTKEELAEATKRMCRRRTAPGPDGVHGTVLGAMTTIAGDGVRETFSECLREGVFPNEWKEANLVLIPKPGKPGKYRPICMLAESGKLLERIIASRITKLLESVGPDLADSQYGFRRGRSTIDAVRRVLEHAKRGGQTRVGER